MATRGSNLKATTGVRVFRKPPASGGGEGEVGWGEGREGKRGGETKGMKAKRGGDTEGGEGKQLSNMKFVICRCSIRVVGKSGPGILIQNIKSFFIITLHV